MKTMTAIDLIGFLSAYPPNTPVLVTWEGVHAKVLPKNIVIEDINGVETLEIDVNEYGDYD